mmetsp:Transcript_25727/g.60031  ORF Transcript_25727/g.60031 Transcript_25727/m.60031 type:complete len:328 (-) Transcript_25727:8-991(-)
MATKPAEEAPAPPPKHFGMVFLRTTGCMRHAMLYPHEYLALPVRSPQEAIEHSVSQDTQDLQPCLFAGKAPFKFFGLKLDATSSHARCWFSSVLHKEVQQGGLAQVTLVLENERELLDVAAERHWQGAWTSGWLWECKVPSFEAVVMVNLRLIPNKGVRISTRSDDEEARSQVHHLLCQYCDLASLPWHPIPDRHGKAPPPPDSDGSSLFAENVPDERALDSVRTICAMESLREHLTREELVQHLAEAAGALVELKQQGHKHGLDLEALFARSAEAVVAYYMEADDRDGLRNVLPELQEATLKAGVPLPPHALSIVMELEHSTALAN